MSASRVLAISKDEFRRMLTKCRPPNGWPNIVAVANSGGPDSTCLLFLLHRYLLDHAHQEGAPQRLISMSIDHDLQPCSASMAESSEKYALSLPGVEHMTAKVPWSTPPFPRRPEQGKEAIENTARSARYQMLYRCMNSVPAANGGPANLIAFGHHADDQVETALMRFGKGTTELGAAGMRACRRWGMGPSDVRLGEQALGWVGLGGMSKWIVRPLLDVSKDRILATCEENKIEYVTDESNFQPHITIRNAIRTLISSGRTLDDIESVCPEPLPPAIKEQLSHIDSAISSVDSISVDLNSGAERLRGAVKQLATQVEDIDSQVDRHLKRCIIPSPPGTLLLSLRGLLPIHGDLVRIALILRVMRYVSFYPWGSIRADGNRRKKMREQILDRIWSSNPFENGRGMFVAGGGVLWTPVLVRGTKIKTPDRFAKIGMDSGEVVAWLASRQPPMHKYRMAKLEIVNPLRIDLTEMLRQTLEDVSNVSNHSTTEILYDYRFLMRFDISKIPLWIYNELRNPDNPIRISIVPNTRWYWPEVILEKGDESQVLHSDIGEYEQLHPFSRPPLKFNSRLYKRYWRRQDTPVASDWIHVDWVRPLSAI